MCKKGRSLNKEEQAHLGEELSDALFCIIYAAHETHNSPDILPDISSAHHAQQLLIGQIFAPFEVPNWKYWIDETVEALGRILEILNHCVEANRPPNDVEQRGLGEQFWYIVACIAKAALTAGIPPESLPELNRAKLEKRIKEGILKRV